MIQSKTSIDFDKKNNKKYPKFNVGNHVRISKNKNIFLKGYVPNWSEEIFVITKIKSTVPWRYVISDLKGEEIVGMLYEKQLKKIKSKKSKRIYHRKSN